MRSHALWPAFLAAVATGCAGIQPVSTVKDGALYRSGQLTPAKMEIAVREHDIRTVVNLRGRQPDAKWYQDQTRLLKDLRVKQIDVPVGTAADPDAVEKLLATFKEEDKPILVHSQWPMGSAGFASAVYRVGVAKDPPSDARKELAFWQDRRLPFIPGAEQDRFLADWKPSEPRANSVVAAKRPRDASLEDFGLDGFDAPAKETANVPKRWPWTKPAEAKPPGAKAVDEDFDSPTVVLGRPKPLPDGRVADRSEAMRY